MFPVFRTIIRSRGREYGAVMCVVARVNDSCCRTPGDGCRRRCPRCATRASGNVGSTCRPAERTLQGDLAFAASASCDALDAPGAPPKGHGIRTRASVHQKGVGATAMRWTRRTSRLCVFARPPVRRFPKLYFDVATAGCARGRSLRVHLGPLSVHMQSARAWDAAPASVGRALLVAGARVDGGLQANMFAW